MATNPSDHDWLNPAFVTCSCCKARLFSVEHSGFYDEWYLYCGRCANRVEVSFYDPVVCALPGGDRYDDRFRLIEHRLCPCACGGSFGFTSARRCPFCQTVVLEGPTSLDLWPEVYGVDLDGREPTADDERAAEAFVAKYIRLADIWRSR